MDTATCRPGLLGGAISVGSPHMESSSPWQTCCPLCPAGSPDPVSRSLEVQDLPVCLKSVPSSKDFVLLVSPLIDMLVQLCYTLL